MDNNTLNSVVLTAKQARFVNEFVVDNNATQAAIRSGYAESGARVEGSRLLANANIQDAVAKAQREISDRNALTIDDLLKELEEARVCALTAETAQSSAAVAATMGKAKMLGFLIDKVDVNANIKAEVSSISDLMDELADDETLR